eukprot:1181734-Prorocentrum_minimum.AAC.3
MQVEETAYVYKRKAVVALEAARRAASKRANKLKNEGRIIDPAPPRIQDVTCRGAPPPLSNPRANSQC